MTTIQKQIEEVARAAHAAYGDNTAATLTAAVDTLKDYEQMITKINNLVELLRTHR